MATGLTPRIHGNTRRQPKNALKIEEIKNLLTFLYNYAENNAILLPGRIPGYKRDNIQLLPSSTTKKVHQVAHTYTHVVLSVQKCIPHTLAYIMLEQYVTGSEKRDHFALNAIFCHFSNCHHFKASRALGFWLGL